MTTVNQYRLRCTTEDAYKYVWAEAEPTTCPTDTGHTIDEAQTTIVKATSTEQVSILNDAGDAVNWPMTTAKTPIYQPNIVPPGYLIYCTGAFDDISGGKRGEGNQLALKKTSAGEAEVTGRFLEHVYILGGGFGFDAGNYDDWVSLEVSSPASAPASTPGIGNANKTSVGPFNIIIPVTTNDGSHTVDGSTMEAGEINQSLSPVPNATVTGYWNWDPDALPSITPVADPANPDGDYDLFDGVVLLARQANRVPLMVGGQIVPPTVKGKKILPHWIWKFVLHRENAAGDATAGIMLTVARKSTT